MKLLKVIIPSLMVGILFVMGCSHGASPVTPDPRDVAKPVFTDGSTSHALLGLYTLVCDPQEGTVDIISLRDTDFHLNALKFLEPPANMYLKILGPVKINGNILDLNLSLTHPFLAAVQYTGFDVSGILFTHGSKKGFHDPDITMAGPGDTRLLNADGYTRWWNPKEFPHGNTMLTYIDGLLGNPAASANYNCTLNGYKFFADGLQSNAPLSALDHSKRGLFGAGQTNVRHYTIDMSGGLVFNYAVDACWRQPLGKPPFTAPSSFPEDANRTEAYYVKVTEIYNTLYYDKNYMFAGGNIKLQLDVYDHFKCSLNQVWGESLDGLPYVGMAAPISGTATYSTYELDFHGGNLKHSGTGEILIEVRSEALGYPPVLPTKPLCAYFLHRYNISDQPPLHPDGWGVNWGGSGNDRGFGVTADSEGNSYVTGYFRDSVDFDPGDGECIYTSKGGSDISLSKFNPYGEFQWARTWGSSSDSEQGWAIDIDAYDNVYVVGYFNGTVDFDPGPGIDERTSNGGLDAFMSKFDVDGNLIWVRTWGGTATDCGRFVKIGYPNNVYFCGYYNSQIDLDPGPGVDLHNNNGSNDVFLCRLDANGNLIWGRTFGGSGSDTPYAVAVTSLGDIYISGGFSGTVDFDPGMGTDQQSSKGSTDVFLSKFTSNGDYIWALTWGGTSGDYAEGVAVSYADDVYVAGNFYNVIDFDPGPGEDIHSAVGGMDVFLTKFDSSGSYGWTLTWGSNTTDDVHMMTIRGGSVFATGHFGNTMDFDPTAGTDLRTAVAGTDIYLVKVDCFANYVWARTWGGTGNEYSRGFAADSIGNLFLTGGFLSSSIDLNPGPGVDMHYGTAGDVYLIKMLPNGYW